MLTCSFPPPSLAVLPRGNDNMFSSSGDAYQPQEHHKDTDALWEAIRSEARSDSVSSACDAIPVGRLPRTGALGKAVMWHCGAIIVLSHCSSDTEHSALLTIRVRSGSDLCAHTAFAMSITGGYGG